MVEQLAVNQRVVGSSPTSGAIFFFAMSTFWTYILRNPAGKFSIGSTQDLFERLRSHNNCEDTRGKYTRKNGPWELVWSEQHPTRRVLRQ